MTEILVLGTADWGQSIATNQHYVVRELARDHQLIFTESMGLRAPEFSLTDLRRMAHRIGIGSRPRVQAYDRPIPGGVDVRSPAVLPRHVGLAARFNRPRVHRLTAHWIAASGPKVLWTYTPVTYGLEKLADVVIYHCVDLLGEVEGVPKFLIDQAERRLASVTAVAVGTSPVVVDHLRHVGFPDVRLWPNVADTGVIEAARPHMDSRAFRRVVFAGNLTAKKVDFDLLAAIVDADFDLHLAGPVADGGGRGGTHVQALVKRGATYRGVLDPTALAELYWTAEVGVIPYVLNAYTRGVSPLKTFEYLAAGLGVVSTAVPSVEEVAGHVVVVRNRHDFVSALSALLASGHDKGVEFARIRLARTHSWPSRGEDVRALVQEVLS